MPWILDLGDHREIAGNAVTPLSTLKDNQMTLDRAFERRRRLLRGHALLGTGVSQSTSWRSHRRRTAVSPDRAGIEPARNVVGVRGRCRLECKLTHRDATEGE